MQRPSQPKNLYDPLRPRMVGGVPQCPVAAHRTRRDRFPGLARVAALLVPRAFWEIAASTINLSQSPKSA